MKLRTLFPILAIVALATAAACSEEMSNAIAPEDALVLAGKGNGNGGGGGGGGGSSDAIEIDMSGGFTAIDQAGVIVSDNKKRTEIAGCFGTSTPCVTYAFAFSDKVEPTACWTDPADMDPATRDELFAHLDDGFRIRTLSAVIEKDGAPKTLISGLYNDDTGQRYKIALRDASAAQGPKDHYLITGGTVWTLKDGLGQFLYCPFTGEVELTVTR